MGAFGFKGEDGNVMPLRMETSCQVHGGDILEYFKNEDCTPWTRTGSSLKAYDSLISDVLVDYDLTYPVYFTEQGVVTFKYRKDSISFMETSYGVFKFLIDGEVQMLDDDMTKNEFQTVTFPDIPPGLHTLVWRYTKLNKLPLTEFMESEIEVSKVILVIAEIFSKKLCKSCLTIYRI